MESRSIEPTVLGGCDETEITLAPRFQAFHDDYGLDSDLFNILYKVNIVTQDINTINPPKSEAVPISLRQKMWSVQYYLLSKENGNDSSGSADQVLKSIRLGVLLYIGIIQNGFWVAAISKRLLYQLKSCLQVGNVATGSILSLRL